MAGQERANQGGRDDTERDRAGPGHRDGENALGRIRDRQRDQRDGIARQNRAIGAMSAQQRRCGGAERHPDGETKEEKLGRLGENRHQNQGGQPAQHRAAEAVEAFFQDHALHRIGDQHDRGQGGIRRFELEQKGEPKREEARDDGARRVEHGDRRDETGRVAAHADEPPCDVRRDGQAKTTLGPGGAGREFGGRGSEGHALLFRICARSCSRCALSKIWPKTRMQVERSASATPASSSWRTLLATSAVSW